MKTGSVSFRLNKMLMVLGAMIVSGAIFGFTLQDTASINKTDNAISSTDYVENVAWEEAIESEFYSPGGLAFFLVEENPQESASNQAEIQNQIFATPQCSIQKHQQRAAAGSEAVALYDGSNGCM